MIQIICWTDDISPKEHIMCDRLSKENAILSNVASIDKLLWESSKFVSLWRLLKESSFTVLLKWLKGIEITESFLSLKKESKVGLQDANLTNTRKITKEADSLGNCVKGLLNWLCESKRICKDGGNYPSNWFILKYEDVKRGYNK